MFLTPKEMIQVSEEWKEILTELARNGWGSVYVLGGIDSGKSTFFGDYSLLRLGS